MAGDWIKMRADLLDDPSVVKMAISLDLDEFAIVGRLHKLWSWADCHTIDGKTDGVTGGWIDRYVCKQGFAAAMVDAGWLVLTEHSVEFPSFDRHNGVSAKRRSENTLRQRLSRNERDKGATGCGRAITPRPFVRRVIERDMGACVYCGTKGGRSNKLGVDHIVPCTRGGKDAIENLVTCCSACNNEKNDRTPEEWGMSLEFLPEHVKYDEASHTVTDLSRKLRDKSVTREEKRREEIKGSLREPLCPAGKQPDRSADVEAVVKHYRTYHTRALPNVTSDAKEYRKIAARLKEGYTVADLCEAIDGCHKTPHNLGQNDRGAKYLDLELIVRSASHVNRFIENSRSPPKAPELASTTPKPIKLKLDQ